MGLAWCYSGETPVPGEPFCSPGMLPSRCPSRSFAATALFPRSIFSAASRPWLMELSSFPAWPGASLSLSRSPDGRVIGTHPVELSLGHGCPSQRQLLLMDGFRVSPAPCSQFAVFPLKVIINPVIAAVLHNFLFSEEHPSTQPRLDLMYRLCPFPGDIHAAISSRFSLPAGSSNP